MGRRRLLGVAVAFAAIVSGAVEAHAADQWIDGTVELAAPCGAPSSVQAVYKSSLSLPREIGFLLGNKGTLEHESAQIGDVKVGAYSSKSIILTSGTTVLVSGFSNSRVEVRLVIEDKYFCVSRPKIVLTYTVTDDLGKRLPGLRITLRPSGTAQELALTTEGRSLAMRKIDEKYAEHIKYFIADRFSWLDDHLDPTAGSDRKEKLCRLCYYSGRVSVRLVTAFALFLDSVDPLRLVANDEPRPLSTWGGTVVFAGGSRINPEGIVESGVSVDLEFSKDNVLTIANDPYAKDIALRITRIMQHGKAVRVDD